MEAKVNYAFVGLFVLVLGVCSIIIPLWLGVRSSARDYNRYVVFMSESVAGLNKDAPVKYRGVDIGHVTAITLDPDNPARIKLLLEIEHDTPIRTDTIATLETQGLTGIAYLNLSGKLQRAPLLEPRDEEPYPEIPSGPSLFFRLEEEASRLMKSLGQTAESLHALFTGPAPAKINRNLDQLDTVLASLASQSADLSRATRAAAHALEQSATASDELPELVTKLAAASDELRQMAEGVRQQSLVIGAATAATAAQLNRVSEESGRQLQLVATDLQRLIQRLENLAAKLEEQPQGLLFGAPQPAPGPGETGGEP